MPTQTSPQSVNGIVDWQQAGICIDLHNHTGRTDKACDQWEFIHSKCAAKCHSYSASVWHSAKLTDDILYADSLSKRTHQRLRQSTAAKDSSTIFRHERNVNTTVLGRPFVKRFALCYQTVVSLSITLVYCGQTVGWIKMKLGMQVGLGPGHIVLDGYPAPPPPKGHSSPPFFGPYLLWPNG